MKEGDIQPHSEVEPRRIIRTVVLLEADILGDMYFPLFGKRVSENRAAGDLRYETKFHELPGGKAYIPEGYDVGERRSALIPYKSAEPILLEEATRELGEELPSISPEQVRSFVRKTEYGVHIHGFSDTNGQRLLVDSIPFVAHTEPLDHFPLLLPTEEHTGGLWVQLPEISDDASERDEQRGSLWKQLHSGYLNLQDLGSEADASRIILDNQEIANASSDETLRRHTQVIPISEVTKTVLLRYFFPEYYSYRMNRGSHNA